MEFGLIAHLEQVDVAAASSKNFRPEASAEEIQRLY
jgi:hypothetical protein